MPPRVFLPSRGAAQNVMLTVFGNRLIFGLALIAGLAPQLTSACWLLQVPTRDLAARPPHPLRFEAPASRGCLRFPGTPATIAARGCAASNSAPAISRTQAAYPARHQSAAVICHAMPGRGLADPGNSGVFAVCVRPSAADRSELTLKKKWETALAFSISGFVESTVGPTMPLLADAAGSPKASGLALAR